MFRNTCIMQFPENKDFGGSIKAVFVFFKYFRFQSFFLKCNLDPSLIWMLYGLTLTSFHSARNWVRKKSPLIKLYLFNSKTKISKCKNAANSSILTTMLAFLTDFRFRLCICTPCSLFLQRFLLHRIVKNDTDYYTPMSIVWFPVQKKSKCTNFVK